ncbi:MAG: hypothetical protein A2934_05670 [Candidatus Sungbacteria bacterium RIFCSPLOWO2_01_FULL_47_10]|uniref:alanine--tRNA ligase n=1 Tax=Candidatus Sungbacteria bacterium RIFCSPLOWO2_01_FULL_47_10 TaxID=1802276 RepID=A0A1G2L4T8_9BACT|nr:MAG: hypothetical protein A2934_05670 [Candidatus Sungbacteria bacterium RIFCSPLOWO2_01_FULL_47_10]
MEAKEIRKKFLQFFEKRGHAVVPSSSLIPDDPSVLLTTAGMQQFKKYYTGEADATKDFGTLNTASVQKSFRTSDIDEVGDESHLTFFEMLGNFSFGGYFKKEAIEYAYDFITKEMGLEISYVTIFEGKDDIGVPKDEVSKKIWQSLAPELVVKEEGMEDVFWGPTGTSGPCGPTTEIYCKNAEGKDIEVWNLVFNEFFFSGSREELLSGNSGKKLEKLRTPGVDTGMGFERLVMIAQKKKNIFETDLFLEPFLLFLMGNNQRGGRIIADHMRAIIFLLADGVRSSNKGAGYILRRLMRRAIVQTQLLGFSQNSLLDRVPFVIKKYGVFSDYFNMPEREAIIKSEFGAEMEKFGRTLKTGIREFFNKFPEMNVQRIIPGRSLEVHIVKRISGDDAFYFHQSFGLTLDIIKDLARKGGHIVEVDDSEFEIAREKHREISRAGQEKKFGGHGLVLNTGELKAANEEEVKIVTRLHTATHLLNAALRKVLGQDVRQDGSDITAERTRFDFTFPRKLTPEELKNIEDAVHDAIQKNLTVKREEMDYKKAIQSGALHFFKEKYPRRVSIYTAYDPKTGEELSKEFCGGPHVEHTGEIGRFKIIKEESSSAGVRRIRATVE